MRTRMVAVALATLLLGAGTAGADTLVVDQAAGPYTTISGALADAADGDTVDVHAGRYEEQVWVDADHITVHGEPGTTVASTGPFAAELSGDGDTLDGLTVAGGVVVNGDQTTISHATITAGDDVLALSGKGHTFVHHTLVRALDDDGTAVVSRNDAFGATGSDDTSQRTTFQTDIVVGGRLGTAFDVRSGRAGEAGTRGGIDLGIASSTVTGAATALSSGSDGQGGPVWVGALDSIVHGSAPGLVAFSTETTASDAADFVDPQALDLHLRADAPAAMFATSPGLDGSVINRFALGADGDFDGTSWLTPGITSSVGAYAFVDRPPTATYTVSPNPEVGRPVTLDASSSVDPDAAIGGRIVKYMWQLQDQNVTTTSPVLQHTWKSYNNMGWGIILTTVDNNGRSTSSPHAVLAVPDHTPPVLTFKRPADRARLHRYTTTVKGHRRHEAITVVRVTGQAAGLDGIDSVMVTVRRKAPKVKATEKRRPAPCQYVSVSGRLVTRDCAKAPPTFKVMTQKGGAWGWASPQHAPFPAGRWALTATATDVSGNVGSSVLHFTVT